MAVLTAHVNIGSNIGDRHALIERAVAAIGRMAKATVRLSSPFESEPWGFESPNSFINLGVAFETDLPPFELLRQLRLIESRISDASHRTADGCYADRMIDIDLIAVGQIILSGDGLTLPHPRMHLREFVLRPIEELEPGWRHPLLGLTPSEMLARLDK